MMEALITTVWVVLPLTQSALPLTSFRLVPVLSSSHAPVAAAKRIISGGDMSLLSIGTAHAVEALFP